MQSAVIRETGWGVAEYRDQPAADVFDLLADLAENPPAYRILAWRYLQQKPKQRARQPERDEMAELTRMMGGAQRMPESVREMAMWAQAESARALGKKG